MLSITVNNTNDSPTVTDVSAEGDEDSALIFDLTGSDVDSGDSLSYSIERIHQMVN